MHNHNGSKSRGNLRSPIAHPPNDDSKLYKKKYQEMRQMLKLQKRMREQLEGRVQQLQCKVAQYEQLTSKQEHQLQKKQQINEVLLDRIRCLKNAQTDHQTKRTTYDSTSYDEKNYTKSNKSSTSNEDPPQKNQPVVGGYFGSIFK